MNEQIVVERDLPATMRDGTVLRADIYRPARAGKFPVLLQRNLYGKDYFPFSALTMNPLSAAQAGYVVVIQDVRGRFKSDGARFYPYRHEFTDGYDSVEWAASLPYADGSVGMYGASYMGMTQWQAAVMNPPSLKAIAPATWGTGSYLYRGGAFELGQMFTWCLKSIGPGAVMRANRGKPEHSLEMSALAEVTGNIERDAFAGLPLKGMDWQQLGGRFAAFLQEIMDHDTYDSFHRELDVIDKVDRVFVPALGIAGWYDALLERNLTHFMKIKQEAADRPAGEKTRLLVGPWAHSGFLNTVGELNFGLAAAESWLDLETDLSGLHLRWFDCCLKGIDNGISEEPPVKIFVMGKNRWRGESEWPLARANYTPYYFHSGGGANSMYGDGFLSAEPPAEEEPDYFLYDPRNPVPTRGGNIILPFNHPRGPVEQSSVEKRADVLVYTSAPLEQGLEVTGPVKVRLFAASSAPDTDFTAKLVDLYPDGRAYNVADGIIRARYRDGADASSLITPGEVYDYEIDLWSTSCWFDQGHRLRVEISSSSFPRYDRNLNTGALSRESSTAAVALQTVYHNDRYPSQIILPLVPA